MKKAVRCLTFPGGGNNHGDKMQIWYANSDKAQKFKIIFAGSGFITSSLTTAITMFPRNTAIRQKERM
jgi:hypothetical protein